MRIFYPPQLVVIKRKLAVQDKLIYIHTKEIPSVPLDGGGMPTIV